MSQLEVDKIIPQSGTTLTIGDSGDTISFADGATLAIDTNTLAIDSTNNRVGIGTSSPSTPLHVSTSAENVATFASTDTGARIVITDSTDTGYVNVSTGIVSLGQTLGLSNNNLNVDSSGNVGIGTTSPTDKLNIHAPNSQLRLTDTDDSTYVQFSQSAGKLVIRQNTLLADHLTLDSSGNVGIGTSAPAHNVEIVATASGSINDSLQIRNNATATGTGSRIRFINSTDKNSDTNGASIASVRNVNDNDLVFETENSERMRIDSSGNVLVGKTSDAFADEGVVLATTQSNAFTRNGANVMSVRRNTSDGDIVSIYKDTTAVGRIGSISGVAMYINAPNDGGGGFLFTSNAATIYPTRRVSGTVDLSDNTIDLGAAVWRFNDAYITNGVTTGSDQNEKQQIQLLTDSEIVVAKRISKGFKTFKWNSAVEEKGDNARIHTGVIAQEVQQAFTDEGLDVTKYAFFMSNTYWEKERVIPAVEEITDEEGNITQEAQPEHTAIDKWEVESEAPEGAVQKIRLGIRYPELLSFVSSAFEQRLTDIETRLTALET